MEADKREDSFALFAISFTGNAAATPHPPESPA